MRKISHLHYDAIITFIYGVDTIPHKEYGCYSISASLIPEGSLYYM
jgi:hypothetical protein